MAEYKTLEEYAEHIRQVTARLSVRAMAGYPIAEQLGELCAEAAGIVNQTQMAEEVARGEYDLSALGPVALPGQEAGEDEGNPFAGE